MSYGPPQGNPYGAPPPQGGYGGYPPPQQQQWGAPQGPPPGQYQQQPPQGHYQQGPPQQQWGPPQGPPPGQYQQGPPQGQYQQGPPQWQQPPGPPPNQQQWNAPPGPPPGQQQQWGAPHGGPPQQQQQWGAPPGAPPFQQAPSPVPPGGPAGQPSLGYVPGALAQGWQGSGAAADSLRAAMKGFGTNEKQLIQTLVSLDPLQVNSVKQAFTQRHKRNLEKDVESETSKYFKEGCLAIVRGPLEQDAHNVRDAVVGVGTNEDLLNDIVLGRSNADLRAIKQVYSQKYHRRMEDDIAGDLTFKTKDLFRIVLAANRAEENTPVNPQQVDRDVDELNRALQSRGEQVAVANVMALRSEGQLRAISHAFQQKYKKSLRETMKAKFDGHMEDALLLMHDRAVDPVMADATQLEAAMAGLGTKDKLLVNRVVRVHWDRQHKDQVKRAYQQRYKKDLITRVKGEIQFSKDYENLMVACLT